MKCLIGELTRKTIKTTLYIYNQSTICLIKNGIGNKRSKHINVRYRFINEKVTTGLNIKYWFSDTRLDDIFTKALGHNKFETHKSKLVI